MRRNSDDEEKAKVKAIIAKQRSDKSTPKEVVDRLHYDKQRIEVVECQEKEDRKKERRKEKNRKIKEKVYKQKEKAQKQIMQRYKKIRKVFSSVTPEEAAELPSIYKFFNEARKQFPFIDLSAKAKSGGKNKE